MANFINTTLCFCNIFHKNNENAKKSLLCAPKCGMICKMVKGTTSDCLAGRMVYRDYFWL